MRSALGLLCLLLTFVGAGSAAEPVVTGPAGRSTLRLRVAWGGGAARCWKGSLAVKGGQLSNLAYLGLEADQPATIYVERPEGDTVVIDQRSACQYVGFDVQVEADATAAVALELVPSDRPQETQRVELALSSLFTGHHHRQLDDQGNRLLVQRVPGDDLRILLERSSLVFSPGEIFVFRVQPHLLQTDEAVSLRCAVEMVRAGTDDVVWGEAREFTLEPDVEPPAVGPFAPSIPWDEGVYDLKISLVRPRLRDTFLGAKPLRTRQVQLVVISPETENADRHAWELVEKIDPDHASWMEWLTHVPKLPLLPDFRQEPLGNGKSKRLRHLEDELVELPPGAWQAYPLGVRELGRPHLLEVEYPSDKAQTLGISILEPNATGDVVPIELDSGVDTDTRWSVDAPRMLRHRLVFWPRTKTPLVLLTNHRDKDPAVFGEIRVLAGPSRLPALPPPPEPLAGASGRLLAVYFDKPLFPENFSAGEAADAWTGRSLDDWRTFLEGGQRLVEYLRYAGYNGAVVSVNCQGSTLYPSELVRPNPKYDTGAFFGSGQDPIRKDVLEMLFRLFDREGLTLVPAVQFSSPLVELEQRRRRDPRERVGIELVNGQGERWVDVHGTERGMAPYYNPLDPRVQRAMRAVLREITTRYAQHAAFGGIALQLEPYSYAVLPGQEWGKDAVTWNRFTRDDRSGPGSGDEGSATADGFRSRDQQKRWLAWRAEVMAGFHRDLAADVVGERADGRLFLLTGNLFTAPAAQQYLRPTLPNRLRVGEAMAQLGLDVHHYADEPNVVLFRPDRIVKTDQPAAAAEAINLNSDAASHHYFAQAKTAAALFFHEPITHAMPSFDKVSPFGAERTRVTLVSHVAPSAARNRQRFVRRLAEQDVQVLLDGGWMVPLGQEDALRPLLQTLTALPALPFRTVQPRPSGVPTQPLVVRTLAQDDQTYLYVVNNSPWSVAAEVDLNVPARCAFQPLGGRELPEPQWNEALTTWTLTLEPYDLVAAVFGSGELSVDTWRSTLDRQAFLRLRDQVNAMRDQVNALRQPTPLRVVKNPGFELSAEQLPGWIYARGEGLDVRPDQEQPFAGAQSLKLSSQGRVAWIRSDPIEPPRSGRISMMVRLRTEDAERQPPLRLSVEGYRGDGSVYYKPASVGANNQPLSSQWGRQPFMLHINNLPVGGWSDLRVGFDLMGAGTVWIDDVQTYDCWFLPNERDELMIMSAVATMSLNKGQIADTLRVLEGYWPRFLNQYVSPGELRTAALPVEDRARKSRAFPPPQQKRSMLDKVKQRLPKRVFPFQLKF